MAKLAMTFAMIVYSIVGLNLLSAILVVLNTSAFAQNKDESHPSFLEAGIFFITGKEPPNDVQLLGPNRAAVRDIYVQPNGSKRYGLYEFRLEEDHPCTIYSGLLEPPWGAQYVEFMKLPSPRAMKLSGPVNMQTLQMELPPDTWCEAKVEKNPEGDGFRIIDSTIMCNINLRITDAYIYRRLKALDYIRANFCVGQPEPPPPPPPPPPKPY
jgi:hypothetical protein